MFQANLVHSCGIAAQRTQCGFSSSRTRSKLPFKSQLHQRFDSEPGEPLECQPSHWGGRVQTLEAVSPRWLGHRPSCQWGIAFSSSHCNQAKPRITQLCPALPQRKPRGAAQGPILSPCLGWGLPRAPRWEHQPSGKEADSNGPWFIVLVCCKVTSQWSTLVFVSSTLSTCFIFQAQTNRAG